MLKIQRTSGEIRIRVPADFYPQEGVERHVAQVPFHTAGLDVVGDRKDLALNLSAPEETLDDLTLRLFSRLNGIPNYSVPMGGFPPNHPDPEVSCIIILTGNDIYAIRQLIPSIFANSKGHRLEIIVVHNGAFVDLHPFQNFGLYESEFGCVSKAYNLGASKARAPLLAIFHDDCMVLDPMWLEKSMTLLDQGCVAVTPEFAEVLESRLPNAKNVPLVIRQTDFRALGGYDEKYYIGYEDLDFTHLLKTRELRCERVDFDYVHHSGMSTIILHNDHPHLFRYLFGLNILPKKRLPEWRQYHMNKLQADEKMQLVMRNQLRHFLKKFRDYFLATGQEDVLKREGEYVDRLAPGLDGTSIQSREACVAHYRNMVLASERGVLSWLP